jgi:hypothetical protein
MVNNRLTSFEGNLEGIIITMKNIEEETKDTNAKVLI